VPQSDGRRQPRRPRGRPARTDLGGVDAHCAPPACPRDAEDVLRRPPACSQWNAVPPCDRVRVARPAPSLRAMVHGRFASRQRRWTVETRGAVGPHPRPAPGELVEAGRIDWELWCINGSHVRAHRVAAGARENRPPREPADRAGAHPRRVHAQACTSSLTATACHWPSRSAPAKRTRAGDDAELVRIAARLLGFRRVVSDLQANGLRSIGHMAVFWVAIKVLTLRVISANASYREKFFCNLCA
jgi:hypothetical protein